VFARVVDGGCACAASPRRRRVRPGYACVRAPGFAQMEWFGPVVAFGQSGQGGFDRIGKVRGGDTNSVEPWVADAVVRATISASQPERVVSTPFVAGVLKLYVNLGGVGISVLLCFAALVVLTIVPRPAKGA